MSKQKKNNNNNKKWKETKTEIVFCSTKFTVQNMIWANRSAKNFVSRHLAGIMATFHNRRTFRTSRTEWRWWKGTAGCKHQYYFWISVIKQWKDEKIRPLFNGFGGVQGAARTWKDVSKQHRPHRWCGVSTDWKWRLCNLWATAMKRTRKDWLGNGDSFPVYTLSIHVLNHRDIAQLPHNHHHHHCHGFLFLFQLSPDFSI